MASAEPPATPAASTPAASTPSEPPTAPAPGAPRATRRWLVPVIVAIVVLGGGLIVGLLVLARALGGPEPQIGSCFKASVISPQVTDARSETVDCADARAAYKVVGIVENKTAEQFDPDIDCVGWATARAGVWLGREGEAGTVYCVEDVKQGPGQES